MLNNVFIFLHSKPQYTIKLKEKTNCSVIVNTSFNGRGEPIVNSPSYAFSCFMGTELDKLVIGNKPKMDENKVMDQNKKKYRFNFCA